MMFHIMGNKMLVFTHILPRPACPIYLSAFGQYTDSIKFLLAQAMSAFVSAFEDAQTVPRCSKIAEDAHRRCSIEQVKLYI